MLYFRRTDVNQGTDVNKTNKSKECDICPYCSFLDEGCKFHPHVCNGYHGLLCF